MNKIEEIWEVQLNSKKKETKSDIIVNNYFQKKKRKKLALFNSLFLWSKLKLFF